jgi:DNA helicase-2/ATP-dependent DNA helicase PcrA
MEKAEALLTHLDPEQRKAVTAPIGPVRIVAGAGTGKTRTLIHRIAYWHHMGVAPAGKTLAVTFTNKSASELRHRLSLMEIRGVTARTFHSAALSQLREHWIEGGQTTDFPRLLVGKDQYLALRRAVTASLKPSEDPKAPKRKVDKVAMRAVIDELTLIRSRMIEMTQYLGESKFTGPKGIVTKEEFVAAIQRYEDMKKANNFMDYADVLSRCIRMIENVPHVAAKIRSKYEHFLVDEYQDNDPVQERLLEAWLGGRKSICVVGDPRQTIFSFKGADPKIMRDFPAKHGQAVTIELHRNYRSTKNIVEWANRLMRDTTASGGAKSELSSGGKSGWTPQVRSYYTEKVELEQTAVRIKQLMERSQVPFKEIAVLLRFRDDVAKARGVLKLAGIDTISPMDEFWSDVEPVMKLMKRSATDHGISGKEAMTRSLTELGWLTDSETSEGDSDEYSELGQTLLDITLSIPESDSMSIVQLLDAYKNLEEEGKVSQDGDVVSVMTIHQSKGLEWDAVYLPRFVEGAIPTSHAKTQESIDEERRLAYVAITRARKFLEISWGQTYKFIDRTGIEITRGQSVSSFEQYLRDVVVAAPEIIDEKTIAWNQRFQPPPKKVVPTQPLTDYEILSGSKDTVGSVIKDKKLGQGKIVAVAKSYSIVDFGSLGRFKIEIPPY